MKKSYFKVAKMATEKAEAEEKLAEVLEARFYLEHFAESVLRE